MPLEPPQDTAVAVVEKLGIILFFRIRETTVKWPGDSHVSYMKRPVTHENEAIDICIFQVQYY